MTTKTKKAKVTAYVEVRSQKAPGTWPRQGPDTYVAVQVVPDGANQLSVLRRDNKRGIKIIYCGEGYSRNDGDRSMLGRAIEEASELARKINKKNPWKLDTGNDGCDESGLCGAKADVMADILHHHDLKSWPEHWTLTRE